jgi:hypothetical protein
VTTNTVLDENGRDVLALLVPSQTKCRALFASIDTHPPMVIVHLFHPKQVAVYRYVVNVTFG